MSSSSTGAVVINNNNINDKTASATTQNTQTPVSTVDPDDYDPSYNLNRFLADQNYPLGYKKSQRLEEAEQIKESELKDFDVKFASNGDSLHG